MKETFNNGEKYTEWRIFLVKEDGITELPFMAETLNFRELK